MTSPNDATGERQAKPATTERAPQAAQPTEPNVKVLPADQAAEGSDVQTAPVSEAVGIQEKINETAEASRQAAEEQAAADAQARAANPGEVHMRDANPEVGGESFGYGGPKPTPETDEGTQ